jgi:Uma2 family endonuclease
MAIRDTIARKLTYEDYLHFPEDGLRHELIDGEHFVSPAPTRKHQRTVSNVHVALVIFLRQNPVGELLPASFDVLLSKNDVVQPDLLVVTRERAGVLTDKNAQGAPDLMIEVLSPSTRTVDETLKLALYERAGVREYWMIDPDAETVRVYRRDGVRLLLVQELSAAAGDVLETPLLPGLSLPSAEVFS